jgi:hypothetical protein
MSSDERTKLPLGKTRSTLSIVAGNGSERNADPQSSLVPPPDRLSCAQAILCGRRRRFAFFDSGMFGEPAWDMLLQLYEAEYARERLTAGGLVVLTATPPTVGLRWMRHLMNEGLAAASPGGAALSLSAVRLLPKGRELLDRYLTEVVCNAKDSK